MKKSKFIEEQIVFALKEYQQGTKIDVITRKLGISAAVAGAVWLFECHEGQGNKAAEEFPVEAIGGRIKSG